MRLSHPAWPILWRCLAAIPGGYLFTYTATAALARLLPLGRYDAVMATTLLSFALYTAFILWAFAVHSPRRLALGVALSLPLALIGFWPHLLEVLA
ncbi:MAG TPA: iron transporter [Pseudomonas sp.]|uniref:iron transporter n=1 Tax=Pseudomonas sp. TaxID=306 RepID=UPI002C5CC4AF|nr:iron transporter [Pseudomonas sp.]HTO18213.1 iron transporter [Pseudomonas sp.]